MKKIIAIISSFLIILMLIIPTFALGSPTTDGAYTPPPTPNYDGLIAGYSIMRSYADVTSVFIGSDMLPPGAAIVGGESVDYYPTFMFNTPDTIVAPNALGFGTVDDYASTNAFYHNQFIVNSDGYGDSFQIPGATTVPSFVQDGEHGNSFLYSFPLNNGSRYIANQYGIVSGEWINGSYTDSIVTGYSIKWSNDTEMTVTLKGNLIYGYEGDIIQSINIDRNYNVAAGEIFQFNPQNLLQYEDTINYEYYVFSGNWTCFSTSSGYLIEYKAYDHVNIETVDYLDGFNEYTEQVYSIDLYPIARISSKLSATISSDTGTLIVDIDENGTYSYNVSDYSQINIEVDVPQEVIDNLHIFKWLLDSVQDFLSLEIFPDFSVGGILLFVVGFGLVMWIVKIFLGG